MCRSHQITIFSAPPSVEFHGDDRRDGTPDNNSDLSRSFWLQSVNTRRFLIHGTATYIKTIIQPNVGQYTIYGSYDQLINIATSQRRGEKHASGLTPSWVGPTQALVVSRLRERFLESINLRLIYKNRTSWWFQPL